MGDFKEIVKIQQRYEFLKKHPEEEVYFFPKSDTCELDSKFYCCKNRKKWRKTKHKIRFMVAIPLFILLQFVISYFFHIKGIMVDLPIYSNFPLP